VNSDTTDLFFYNNETGAAAVGTLGQTAETYSDLKEFATGSFASWAHIVTSRGLLLFYNRQTRAGATGYLDPTTGDYTPLKKFPPGAFGDWTEIVTGIFFYSARAGSAASGYIDDNGNYIDVKRFPVATFGDFTNVVPGDKFFFCNTETGAGASGMFDDTATLSTSRNSRPALLCTGHTSWPNGLLRVRWLKGCEVIQHRICLPAPRLPN
jgi:hypothetical protein